MIIIINMIDEVLCNLGPAFGATPLDRDIRNAYFYFKVNH